MQPIPSKLEAYSYIFDQLGRKGYVEINSALFGTRVNIETKKLIKILEEMGYTVHSKKEESCYEIDIS